MQPPADILKSLRLIAVKHAASTPIAEVWQVRDIEGQLKALKVYKNRDPKDEAQGYGLMQAAQGAGTVTVDHYARGVALMEWLDGPTAGDLSRAGQDAAGLRAMIDAALVMHAAVDAPLAGLRPITLDVAALTALTCPPEMAPALKVDIAASQALGRRLLTTQDSPRPLHGDLHHDNVIVTAAGPKMFDAKGMLGETAYECANMFRNPVGANALIRDTLRLRGMAVTLGTAFNVPPKRLLQWSCVRMALSWVWRYGPCLPAAPDDADLLGLYLSIANDAED